MSAAETPAAAAEEEDHNVATAGDGAAAAGTETAASATASTSVETTTTARKREVAGMRPDTRGYDLLVKARAKLRHPRTPRRATTAAPPRAAQVLRVVEERHAPVGDRKPLRVVDALVGDASASALFSARNVQCDLMVPGTFLRLRDAKARQHARPRHTSCLATRAALARGLDSLSSPATPRMCARALAQVEVYRSTMRLGVDREGSLVTVPPDEVPAGFSVREDFNISAFEFDVVAELP